MDDSCAVCAETLEWVAYGPCSHREVCSTCVARLRFICNDRHCCICKSESANIFVTKDLGQFTRTINDFSVLPANPSEGQVGPYWYHEALQAYFDDFGHYKMIKAMCDLSCGACAKINGQREEGVKRSVFENIEQLKSHLFHRHKLIMCSLCLEGRKVFICEQKLYTSTQLQQHVKRGESDVDGNEVERGGFMGHPFCEFCKNPFYGENELYKHMSTEHYTCHICQRQHPGKYEYYRDYIDLETHFRQRHYLCEDESCLAKKFIVFVSESEMKRHNAIEHKGLMSRSKRNAALQIPISIQYRRGNELDNHLRGNGSRNASTVPELSLPVHGLQASLETTTVSFRGNSSAFQPASNNQPTTEISSTTNAFEFLNIADVGPSSRYHQSLGQNSSSASLLESSSFPPLPKPLKSNRCKRRSGVKNTSSSLHQQNNENKNTSSSHAWKENTFQTSSSSSSSKINHSVNHRVPSSSQNSGLSQISSPVLCGLDHSCHTNQIQHRQMRAQGIVSANPIDSRTPSSSGKVAYSAFAPDGRSSGPSLTDFPPISASQTDKLRPSNRLLENTENIHNANKSLIERICASLEFDKDKYAAFKMVSSEFRHNIIGTREYLAYIQQFGLSDLVFEIATLCPDAKKREELIKTVNLERNIGVGQKKQVSTKGKEKCGDTGSSSLNYALSNDVVGNANNMQSNFTLSNNGEVLANDGRDLRGKSKVTDVDDCVNINSTSTSGSKETTKNDSAGGSKKVGNKPQMRVPKFLRNRLGDDAATAHPRFNDTDSCPAVTIERKVERKNATMPVRGVWQNGGGRKLVVMTQRRTK